MRVINFEMDASPTPGVKYRMYERFTDSGGVTQAPFAPVMEDIGQLIFSMPDTLRDTPFDDGDYEFYVTAYIGDEESVPSNVVTKNFTRPEPPANLVISG